MYRRYTIHRDGDLLVEELDAQGKPIDPEPVPAEERLPVELVLHAPDGDEGKAQLLDLLELAYGIEGDGPQSIGMVPGTKGSKGPNDPKGCS
ncbi:MAG: hypothetical protein ACT4TC_22805 [Myxococcaceae bacterium]